MSADSSPPVKPTPNTLAEKHPPADSISPAMSMPIPDTLPVVEKHPTTDSTSSDDSPPKTLEKRHPRIFYIGHIVLVVILLIWPWIFTGVVWGRRGKGGLRAPYKFAQIAQKHPHDVDFFTTALSSTIAFIMTYAYARAITCFSNHLPLDDLLPKFIESWKTPTVEWTLIRERRGHRFFAVLAFYTVIFIFIESGLNAILVPHPFTRHTSLQGTELDFSSTAADCLTWLNDNQIPHNCTWQVYRDFKFTYCLAENQLVDVLESGRSNIQSLVPNNNQTLTFTQLGGVQFLGPIRGVLPIGPKGISAFNTLEPIRGSGFITATSYSYTLNHQGVSGNISCQYDTSSPIVTVIPPPPLTSPFYNGTCPSGQTLPGLGPYPVPDGLNNTIGSWACKTSLLGDSYALYFRGNGNYINAVGNMTCTMSPVQHALFPVQYSGDNKYFTTQNPVSTASNVSTQLLDRSVFAVVNAVGESQGLVSNLVAESIITYGIKDFGIPVSPSLTQNATYLRLVEAMIQGIFQYEATYTRLIYSTYASPPVSCKRFITGSLAYNVFGWEAIAKTAAYLIPLTIINITSLVMFIFAMRITLRKLAD